MAITRLLTATTPLGADAFILTAVSGREELSRPFSFQLELVAELSVTVAPADLVGQGVAWTIAYPDEAPRQFHGVVRRLIAGEVVGRTRRVYRAEVVPWLWFLTRTADCKIFQNKTAPDIITAVFSGFGFSDFKKSLSGTYATRDYCVQYRETAFEFVSRLMEEEGIFYYFEYTNSKHTLVLADATSVYADCSPHNEPEYRPEAPTSEAVHSWARGYEYGSGKYTHTDYNFETPSTSLLATTSTNVSLPGIDKFEVFDYPGNHPVKGTGDGRATVRIEEIEAGYETVNGSGKCSSFLPAGKFKLKNHALDKNAVVLTAVEHSATEPLTSGVRGGSGEYRNNFTAIPATVKYRPERVTRRPVVEGPQTAVVVGPSGEEIYTDKYGRIKVHFHWDRLGKKDENDTCWVRVGELWAGKNWGMIFTPRIGQEVVVDFLEGDPDRPIVTGRVYNAEQMPPYALPGNMTQSGVKTRSTKGGGAEDFNELRFEDKKDSEDIYFHAQKDFHRKVEHDDDLIVLHDQTIKIKNDRTEEVEEGNEKITVSKGNRTVTISKGDESLTVETGKRTTVINADETCTVKTGNRKVEIQAGKDDLKVAQTVMVDAGTSITLKVGGNSILINQKGIFLVAAKFGLAVGGGGAGASGGGASFDVDPAKIALAVSPAGSKMTMEPAKLAMDVAGVAKSSMEPAKIASEIGASKSSMDPAQIAVDTTMLAMKGVSTKVSGTIIQVTADAMSKLGGAIVMVEGSGVTKVSGGIVMIN